MGSGSSVAGRENCRGRGRSPMGAAGSSWNTCVLWGVSDDEAEAKEADRGPHVKKFSCCAKRDLECFMTAFKGEVTWIDLVLKQAGCSWMGVRDGGLEAA